MQKIIHNANCFECRVCYRLYNSQQRYPRLLLCGHTFCQQCLIVILNQSADFKCPYCKTVQSEIRLAQMHKNMVLLEIMDFLDIHDITQTVTIEKETFCQIVDELDKTNKNVTKLVIKRTRNDETNPFEQDLLRKNKKSMRFYKLLMMFQKLEKFEFFVRFSAHGFEECLAQSLNQIQSLKEIKIINEFDEYKRLADIVSLVKIKNVKVEVQVTQWCK